MRIQLDMFAVELGAAILLQFDTDDGIIRILADGGEARHGINARLTNVIDDFNGTTAHQNLHIDLMIGTHYDADHLAGLVEIINHPNMTIGEAWLPPVANDAEPRVGRAEPEDRDLLALQFAGDNGDVVLEGYLRHKAMICERLAAAERMGDEARAIRRGHDEVGLAFQTRRMDRVPEDPRSTEWFAWHLEDASRTIGADLGGHAEEQIRSPFEDERPEPTFGFNFEDVEDMAASWSGYRKGRAEVEAPALALIRRSTAKDAINAACLAKVVKALKTKGVPIACRTIDDGAPGRYVWRAASRRFEPTSNLPSDGPELLLLGPSKALVKKHWQRLPISDYAMLAKFTALPIRPITPSNQLSYIMRVDFSEQRLLICGDAGCVDFLPSRGGSYYPELIAALSPLHVIQVAHHAGHNAHFYRCLQTAQYAKQATPSFLLLSHATQDKHRPSDIFAKFIADVRTPRNDIRLLFTSQPQEPKVRDFRDLFAPVVGAESMNGDVRLAFDQGGWQIKAHAVSPPSPQRTQ